MRPSCLLAFLCFLLATTPAISQDRECGGRETIRIFDGDANQVTCESSATGVIEFRLSSFATPFVMVATDTDNIIQAITRNNKIDFSELGPGAYRVYGLFFKGNLLAEPGMSLDTSRLSDYCYGTTRNFVPINTQEPEAGMISDLNGLGTRYICPDDQSDVIAFEQTEIVGSFTYAITDTNDVVVAIPDSNSYDFNTLDQETSRVYGIAYIGNLTLNIGDTISSSATLSDACFDISDNFLEVIQTTPEAGTVQRTNGETTALLCPGEEAMLAIENLDAAPTPFTLVLTDGDDVVIEVLETNTVDFGTQDPGSYRIYGVSFTGNPSINAGDTLSSATLSDDCFDISDNFVEVTIQFVEGGQVSLENGSRMTEVCVQDGEADELIFVNNSTAEDASYIYILTNEDNEVILPLFGDRIDFDVDLITGVNRVWGLSYTGEFNLSTGQDIMASTLSDGCFNLSSTFVTIIKSRVIGGEISLPDSSLTAQICPEGQADTLSFVTSGSSTGDYAYIATTTDGRIVEVSADTFLAIGTIAADSLNIYGLAYSGELQATEGQFITDAALSDACFTLSQNSVLVTAVRPNTGAIALVGGSTDTLLCPEGMGTALPVLAPDASGGTTISILTDTAGTIITIQEGLDFSLPAGLEQGNYQLWAATYTGTLTLEAGQSLAENPVSNDCFALSMQGINIRWEAPFAGDLSFTDGSDSVVFCAQNGLADSLSWSVSESAGGSLTYLLTDTTNQIVAVSDNASMDADTLSPGIYRIHALAYTGNLTAIPGQDATNTALSDECFQLGTNFLTLDAIQPAGGTVSLSEGGAVFCSGDGTPDVLKFAATGATPQANYIFLVTDTADVFLFDLGDSTSFDFETQLGGNMKVWGLSYTGNLTLEDGDTVTNANLSDDCFSLSANSVLVERQEVDGGMVSTDDGRTTAYACTGDGNPDELTFVNDGESAGSEYLYVVTTDNDLVVATLSGNMQDFENTGFTELRVYGVSYAGNLAASINGNIRDIVFSDGCYELSDNFVTVVRDQPEASRISNLAGESEVTFCPGPDGDTLNLFQTSTSSAGYVYLLMNTDNVLLQIIEENALDMAPLEEGDYLLVGVSYTGQILINEGDTIDPATTIISDNCFVVSDNVMTLRKGGLVDGGMLMTSSGDLTFYTCPGDTIGDAVVVLAPSDTLAAEYRLIITDENDRIEFPDVENPVIDFNRADPGIYRVYGVSFTGNFIPQFNQDLFGGDISSECYEPSGNFIEIFNFTPSSSLVSTSDGLTEVSADGNATIDFSQQGATPLSAYRYLLTDTDNTVIQVIEDSTLVTDTLAEGSYRVWGLNYTGNLLAEAGSQADADLLADNCFILSDNFVSLSVGNPVPGAIQTPVATNRHLRLSPNPATDHLQLQFALEQRDLSKDVRLQIIDLTGSVIIDREVGVVLGSNRLDVSIDQLEQGMYLVRLTNGKTIHQGRFLKARP